MKVLHRTSKGLSVSLSWSDSLALVMALEDADYAYGQRIDDENADPEDRRGWAKTRARLAGIGNDLQRAHETYLDDARRLTKAAKAS